VKAHPIPAGDPRDSAGFVAELRPALVKYFKRRCGAQEAEDLAQEVILRVLIQPNLSAGAQLRGYCFRAAANLWRDRGRRRLTRGVVATWDDAAIYSLDEGNCPERVVAAREEIARVVGVLMELPERTRQVFILNRLEQLTYAQIAAGLGMALSTVEKHMIRALAYLSKNSAGQGRE
jgi:RNA polymerase sigma factor (sigma-70 family)